MSHDHRNLIRAEVFQPPDLVVVSTTRSLSTRPSREFLIFDHIDISNNHT